MKNGMNVVLIVEDDPKLRESLSDYLGGNGFMVLCASDGKQALDLFFSRNHEIDIILLDIMIPEIDGYQVLKTIRSYSDVPIIITTSRESEEDQLEGLLGGADNYLTKPFRLRILKAHMDVLLGKTRNKTRMISFGKLSLNLDSQQAFVQNNEIALTPKEFALLAYFAQNHTRVLSRAQILDAVWGYDYDGDIRTVDTLVKQLRKKLTEECRYIHSVYGYGYSFREE